MYVDSKIEFNDERREKSVGTHQHVMIMGKREKKKEKKHQKKKSCQQHKPHSVIRPYHQFDTSFTCPFQNAKCNRRN